MDSYAFYIKVVAGIILMLLLYVKKDKVNAFLY